MNSRYDIKNGIIDVKPYIYFKPTESNNKLDDIKVLLEYDDNNDNSYKDVRDYIYRIITIPEFLCKGLTPEYISDSFHVNDAVVIIGDSNGILPNKNIFGFAIIRFDEKHNSIYIDVICSHTGITGAGGILMKEIENISKKLSMIKIYLKSVKSAILFYEKCGFIKYDDSCDNMCLMIKDMNKKSMNKKSMNKKSMNKKSMNKKSMNKKSMNKKNGGKRKTQKKRKKIKQEKIGV